VRDRAENAKGNVSRKYFGSALSGGADKPDLRATDLLDPIRAFADR
jgi:hypothetical protein